MAGLTVATTTSAPQPATRKRKQEVLDEDEWTEMLEQIVSRDFFPDVPKLENKLEWLQALRSSDPDALRQAQVNIAQRRAGLRTPIGATPLTGLASTLRTPAGFQTPATPMTEGARTCAADGSAAAPAPPPVSLDTFLAIHTSEDNASFSDIMADTAEKKRQKQPWLHEDKNQALRLEGARDTDGFGSSGQPSGALITWGHQNANRLFYDSSNFMPLALSDKERAELVQGKPRAIQHSNTRLSAQPEDEELPGPGPKHEAPGAAYCHVATPSMTPGVEHTPLMTWGQLEGTPMRLDPSDGPPLAQGSEGPQFHIARTPAREDLGRKISQRATTSLHTNLRGQGGGRSPGDWQSPGGFTPQPGTGSAGRARPKGTPGKPPLSAAGRRLASSLRGQTPASTDAQLRATYAGHRTPSRLADPGRSPASSMWGSTPMQRCPGTPAAEGLAAQKQPVIAQPSSARLTDDLLQI